MPVFIGGAQRSGTSLLRATLGSHPDLAIFQWDLTFWTSLYAGRRWHRFTSRRHRNAVVDALAAHEKYQRADVELPIDQLRGDHIRTWRQLLDGFMRMYAQAYGCSRWGLKTPSNELYADVIFGHFPNARFVHMIRDPRDVAVSIRHVGGGSWSYRPRRHIGVWRRSVEAAIRNKRRWSGQYRVVRYEDLVADRERVVGDLAELCGLHFDSAMLAGNGHPGWTGSNSSFRSPGSRIDRDPEFVNRIEPIYERSLGDLMDTFGSPGGRGHRPAGVDVRNTIIRPLESAVRGVVDLVAG